MAHADEHEFDAACRAVKGDLPARGTPRPIRQAAAFRERQSLSPTVLEKTSGWECVPAAGEPGGEVQVRRLSPQAASTPSPSSSSPRERASVWYSPMS